MVQKDEPEYIGVRVLLLIFIHNRTTFPYTECWRSITRKMDTRYIFDLFHCAGLCRLKVRNIYESTFRQYYRLHHMWVYINKFRIKLIKRVFQKMSEGDHVTRRIIRAQDHNLKLRLLFCQRTSHRVSADCEHAYCGNEFASCLEQQFHYSVRTTTTQ